MAEIQKHHETYEKLNTLVIAISTDTIKQSSQLAQNLSLSFPLLCDESKKIIDRYSLRNPFEHDGIAYPATFLINHQGKVCFRSMDGTGKRLDLSSELSFLEKLNLDDKKTMKKPPGKRWVLLSFKDIWQMGSNMLTMGSCSDWKHFFTAPVSYLKILGNKLKK